MWQLNIKNNVRLDQRQLKVTPVWMTDACAVLTFCFSSTNAHEDNLSYMTLQKFNLEWNLLRDLFQIKNIEKMNSA